MHMQANMQRIEQTIIYSEEGGGYEKFGCVSQISCVNRNRRVLQSLIKGGIKRLHVL